MQPAINFIALHTTKLEATFKVAIYAAIYANPKPLQTLIDEEGCGIIFTELRRMR